MSLRILRVLIGSLVRHLQNLQYSFLTPISSNTLSMSGVGKASLLLGIISSIISIINTTKQVYEAIKDEVAITTNYKRSATILSLISKLLEDTETYVNNAADYSLSLFEEPFYLACG